MRETEDKSEIPAKENCHDIEILACRPFESALQLETPPLPLAAPSVGHGSSACVHFCACSLGFRSSEDSEHRPRGVKHSSLWVRPKFSPWKHPARHLCAIRQRPFHTRQLKC